MLSYFSACSLKCANKEVNSGQYSALKQSLMMSIKIK